MMCCYCLKLIFFIYLYLFFVQYLIINGVIVNTDNLSGILRQKTMRKRCNHMMREMWPPDVMKKMFLRQQNEIDIDVQTLTTAADRKLLRGKYNIISNLNIKKSHNTL